MGFTVRLMLGMVLVLLCSSSIQTAYLNRQIRQVTNNGDNKTIDKLQKIEAQTTAHTVTNLSEENNKKPKTDTSTEDKTIDKQNSVTDKLQELESSTKLHNQEKVENTREEIGRSIDIEKYVSKEFHSKNNVYTLPVSPDTEKYIDPEYDFRHASTHKHEEHFHFDTELTTPKSLIFDHKFKEAVESVGQKLEHIDDSHEISDESESKENITLEKLYDETKKNDTKADLDYISYKNIVSNDTSSKNSLHKDLVVEAGTNLNFRSTFNHTTLIDEGRDSGNNTIVKEPSDEKKVETSTLSNVIPFQDLENAESSTSKNVVLTTRKSITLTKPPSNKNSSHTYILSNNIETETIKAINPVHITESSTKQKEVVIELSQNETSVDVSKRLPIFVEVTSVEPPPVISHQRNKTSPQILQENQVIPVHVVSTEAAQPSVELQTIKENVITITPVPAVEIEEVKASELVTEIVSSTESELMTVSASKETTSTPQVSDETTYFAQNEQETTFHAIESISTKQPETETITSIVTETSTTPWEKMTTETVEIIEAETVPLTKHEIETTTINPEILTTSETIVVEQETTTFPSTIQADSTAVPNVEITTRSEVTQITTSRKEPTTTEPVVTTMVAIKNGFEENPVKNVTENVSVNENVTTENSVRTSKGLIFRESTVTEPLVAATTMAIMTTETATTTETVPTAVTLQTVKTTIEETTEDHNHETTETRIDEHETATTSMFYIASNHTLIPKFKVADPSDSTTEIEGTTDNNTITSDFYEHPDGSDDNSGTIAAITISSIGAVCLILLAGLLVIMRKRQKRFNYGQRCRPVNLDDYSMDNISVYNSVRRKGMLRGSKRSYGNPAFEDPVSVSHPLNFPALGKFSNNLEDIRAEFEDIPQITARTNELPEGCDTKNRYANVIPLPETRVFLSLIEGYSNSDYINANYVTGPKNTKGYYIACQAPMQNTVDDFWRMVWEQQCKVILMLTHLFENGVEKCVDYLPPSEVLDCHRLFGDFQITLKKREVKDKYIISSLQLKNMVSNSWREVTHFWYLGWPERGVPTEANSLIAFLIEARSYMKSASLDRKDVTNGNLTNGVPKNEINPVVVHCSPGTGRTGVVIACDIAIREFEQTRLVDVPRIVYKIRRDRASAVQTKEQYAFIYKVINLYATKLTGGALDSL